MIDYFKENVKVFVFKSLPLQAQTPNWLGGFGGVVGAYVAYREDAPQTTLVTQTLFFGLAASEPSLFIRHLLPKNLFHSMSQAQPLLVLMALSAEPPNPITF